MLFLGADQKLKHAIGCAERNSVRPSAEVKSEESVAYVAIVTHRRDRICAK